MHAPVTQSALEPLDERVGVRDMVPAEVAVIRHSGLSPELKT